MLATALIILILGDCSLGDFLCLFLEGELVVKIYTQQFRVFVERNLDPLYCHARLILGFASISGEESNFAFGGIQSAVSLRKVFHTAYCKVRRAAGSGSSVMPSLSGQVIQD